jgi:hypothetical protein
MKRHVVFTVFSLTILVTPLYAGTESPCEKCRNAAQQELAKCIEGAISQEDKKSCTEKSERRLNACERGVCKSSTGK